MAEVMVPAPGTDELVARLSMLSTSGVSDALDRLAIAGQCLGLAPLDRSFRLAGRAYTIRYGPVGQDPGSVGDYIDDLGPGQVAVLGDGDGVVAIPSGWAAEVIDAAEEIEAAEHRIRAMIESGQGLREARAVVGYHSLQSRRT
jgi:regulator of RNase E activity RraA